VPALGKTVPVLGKTVKEEIQFSLILELSNEGLTFMVIFSVTKSC